MYFSLILVAAIINQTYSLTCSTYYDYSTDVIKCATICPSGTRVVKNKCLNNNQYLIGNQVHICQGIITQDQSLCCTNNTYPYQNKCFQCLGTLYSNICCQSSTYIDLSQNISQCVKLTTGNCPQILLNSPIKICCGSLYYNIFLKKCTSNSGLNCDNLSKICCPSSLMIQFWDKQFRCVQKCSWDVFDSLYCQSKYCTYDNLVVKNNKISPKSGLISFGKKCCIGKKSDGSCLNATTQCGNRFINRGWSICCPFGSYYNITMALCSTQCSGIIIGGTICIPDNFILNLSESVPSLINNSQLCFGKKLPKTMPVCCPPKFFLEDNLGCKYCGGRIYKTTTSQVCCLNNEIFNQSTLTCNPCSGVIDHKGILCCETNQYVAYDSGGISNCVYNCSTDNLYLSKYCCASLTIPSCQLKNFTSTVCNPSYFQDGTCQVCPTLCSNLPQLCTTNSNTFEQCTPRCSSNTVLFSNVCLQCSPQCNECTQPFNPRACISCGNGYISFSSFCVSCFIGCQSCSSVSTLCASCKLDSSTPVLISQKCVSECSIGMYRTAVYFCDNCDSSCLACLGPQSNNCTKCSISKYLNSTSFGSCLNCNPECQSCIKSQKICLKCSSANLILNQQTSSCSIICNKTRILDVYLLHPICRNCHSSCQSCEITPQNCIKCLKETDYQNKTLGINLCVPCLEPCVKCVSYDNCSNCTDGYYSFNNTCNKCAGPCRTCIAGTLKDCLQCYGDSILVNGSCSGCTNSCKLCESTAKCGQCKASLYLYEGSCVNKCPQQTYLTNNTCLNCMKQCKSCVNGTSCLVCRDRYPFKLNQSCLSSCPTKYYATGLNCLLRNLPTLNSQSNNNSGPNQTIISLKNMIRDQTFVIKDNKIVSNIYPQNNSSINISQILFYLLSTNGSKQFLSQFNVSQQLNKITFLLLIPEVDFINYEVSQTYINNQTTSTSKIYSQLLQYQYQRNSISWLKYIGLSLFVITLIFSLLAKSKDHFSAQESNTIILHVINFLQVCYLFRFIRIHSESIYNFLDGFGFSNIFFFPSFFSTLIPIDYVEHTSQRSLIPDGNLLRNAGYTFSYQIIIIGILLLCLVISFILKKYKKLDQMPFIRKILRITIFLFHLGFMNQVFFGFVQLIQPANHQLQYEYFYQSNRIVSIIILILVPILYLLLLAHYYFTYFSDKLQHYYTLRQGSHFILIYLQTAIMMFSIGRPLFALALIGLQIGWLLFNLGLYYYEGQASMMVRIKFIICSILITIGYILLSISEYIPWIALVVIVTSIVFIMLIYSLYQIIGLYYNNFVKPVESQQ